MEDTKKIEEGVYLKRTKLGGCRIIHPYKNEDGTINWFNVWTGGSWFNLINVVVVVLLLLSLSYGYYHDTKACRELIYDPCKLLPNITDYCFDNFVYQSPINSYNLTIDYQSNSS